MERDAGFDVFLSYARCDGAAAAELNDWLRAQGLYTFFDRIELRPGLRWIPALEDAIGRSDAVAILVGPHGFGNTQHYECDLALVRQTRDDRFPVIPVLMPGCESPPTGFLQLLTWIDLSQRDSVLMQAGSLEALRGAIRRKAIPSPPIRAKICPYRGLEPFREEDAAFFCGRDNVIRDLVAEVQANSIVAVVGPSGSGKSSLVFAGLLPALRKQHQTTMWDVVSFRPGASPLSALAAAFGTVPENAGPAAIDSFLEKEAAHYREGDAGKLGRIVDRHLNAMPEKPDRLLIYVDQWEELYAMAPSSEDQERRRQHSGDVERFIALLVTAASEKESRATVVLTVRADFYNPLIRHAQLGPLLPRQQVNILAMRPSDLRSAIEVPAKKAGLSFVPLALVDQILNDVGTEEGRLPLLQFALKETWERREGERLTAEAYTEVGGVLGAIQKTAERTYSVLTPAQKEAARRLFLRLVTPGEGQEDTRARSAIPDDPQQLEIINLFSNPRTRLLVTRYETLQGSAAQAGRDGRATVEIAHEALIRRWPTLRAWVDANRERLRARAVILRAKSEWEEKCKINEFLLDPGIQLERGRALLDSPGDVPVDDIREFVDLSIEKEKRHLDAEREAALADQRRIADAERQAKEVAEDAARLSEIARRKLRNRLIQTAVAAGIALLAFGLSVLAFKVASQNASVARQNALKAEEQTRSTQRQLDRANQAVADGLLNNLDLKSDQPLTERQRNTLWKLATAPETVHRHFISILSASPEDVVRVAARFGEVSRSLGLQWPSPAEAEKLLPAAIAAGAAGAFDVISDLAAKLTETQAEQLLQRIGQTSGSIATLSLVLTSMNLTDAQGEKALAWVLEQIDQTSDARALYVLALTTKELPAKLTEAQAQQALAWVLQQLGQATNPFGLLRLTLAIQALPAKLSEAQAEKAVAWVLQQIDQTIDPYALQALAQALRNLATNLTEAQAQEALTPLLRQVGLMTTKPPALAALALAIQALPTKLTETQTHQASSALLLRIRETTDPSALHALAEAFQTFPTTMTDAQAKGALSPLVRQITQTTNKNAVQEIAEAFEAFVPKLTGVQAQQAFASLLQQIRQTTDPTPLEPLHQVFQALATKLTEAQAQQELALVLEQIHGTAPSTTQTVVAPHALQALAQAFQALAPKLTEAQTQQAHALVLQRIGETIDSSELWALAREFQALAPKLSEAQAEQALAALLPRIDKTSSKAVAQAIEALAPRLAKAQVEQALTVMLRKIGATTDSDTLQALSRAIRALVPRVNVAQVQQSFAAAKSSLAWAATKEEAADWARVFVALLPDVADRDGTQELVATLVYPSAAGPATEVLLEAILASHSDAPAKESGLAASLVWITEKYPELVSRPICPAPPQSASGLKCPVVETEAPTNSTGTAPRD